MLEKYYREALSNILDYASERKECSLYLETIEKMALDALHGKNLTSQCSRPGNSRPDLVCPECRKLPNQCDCPLRAPGG